MDEPMLGFMFGNVDEDNQVDADYLDEVCIFPIYHLIIVSIQRYTSDLKFCSTVLQKALRHLAGLSKLQGGFALEVSDLLRKIGDVQFTANSKVKITILQAGIADEDVDTRERQNIVASHAIQHAPDAKDFADETEAVEDISEPAHNLTGIATAFASTVGAAAEEEDYDFDEEPQHPSSHDQQRQGALPSAATPFMSFLPIPQLLSPQEQEKSAMSMGIDLPFLGKLDNGDVILAFTDLWAPLLETDAAQDPLSQQSNLQQPVEGSKSKSFNPSSSLTAPPVNIPTEKDEDSFLLAGPRELAQKGFAMRKLASGKDGSIEATIRVLEDGRTDGQRKDIDLLPDERGTPDGPGGSVDSSRGNVPAAAAGAAAAAIPSKSNATIDVPSTEATRKRQAFNSGLQAQKGSGGTGSCIGDSAGFQIGIRRVSTRAVAFPQLPHCVFDPVIFNNWEDDKIAEHAHSSDKGTKLRGKQDEGDADSDVVDIVDDQQQDKTIDTTANDDLLPAWQTTTPSPDRPYPSQSTDSYPIVDAAEDVMAFPEPPLLRSIALSEQRQHGDRSGNAQGDANQQDDTHHATAMNEADDIQEIGAHATLLPPEPRAAQTFEWESAVSFDADPASLQKLTSIPIIFDLNDQHLILEQTHAHSNKHALQQQLQLPPSAGLLSKDILGRSSAVILPPRPRSIIAARGVEDDANEALVELAKLDISKDKTYFAAARRRGPSRLGRQVHHAKAALQLETIPLPIHTDFTRWHRPRGVWWPMGDSWKLLKQFFAGKNTMHTLFPGVGFVLDKAGNTVLAEEWKSHTLNKQGKKDTLFGTAVDKPLPLFVIPGDASRPPRVIDGMIPLGQIIDQKSFHSVAIFTEAELYPTAKIEEPPLETTNMALLRPPAAFKFNRDLKSANRGRVVLVEYLEEAPMLLNRPGMGARLTTYYRKTDPSDGTLQQLLQAANRDDERWRVGGLAYLDENDESPFLGEIQPGAPRFALETGLFTSIAKAYPSRPSDFLITRSTAGVMRIREITGSVLSGQELPLHRIQSPGSRDSKDLQERRIYVYIFKKLRQAFEKNKNKEISLNEVAALFPERPMNMIRIFFKDRCGLKLTSKRKVDKTVHEFYELKDGIRLPSEAELRKKVRNTYIATIYHS